MKKDSMTCADVVSRALALAAALALVGLVAAWSQPRSLDLGPTGLTLDRPGSAVVVLITAVAAVVTSFARRSLRGEPYRDRFFVLAAVVAAGSVLVATAATLTLLTAAWLVVSAGVVGLIGLTGTPEARAAARRARRTFAVGDLALVAATVVAVATWGDVSLQEPGVLEGGGALALVGLLVVVAAAARSAQVPGHGWLVGTVWAPTPVSALLHAGVVNAGGVVLIRLWPMVGATAATTHLLVLLGTATLVVGTLQARSRGDVKGALAASTVAQMGFTTLAVGFGAHTAAWLHLLAHGFFKASLFLGSGAAVGAARRARLHPRAPGRPSVPWRVAAVAVPVVAVGAAGVASASGSLRAGDVLVAGVLAAAASAAAGSLLHRTGSAIARVLAIVGSGGLAAGYLAAAHAAGIGLDRDLPTDGGHLPGLLWLVPVAAVVAVTALVVRGAGGRLRSLRAALYGAVVLPPITEGPAALADPDRAPAGPARAVRPAAIVLPATPPETHRPTPEPVGAPS